MADRGLLDWTEWCAHPHHAKPCPLPCQQCAVICSPIFHFTGPWGAADRRLARNRGESTDRAHFDRPCMWPAHCSFQCGACEHWYCYCLACCPENARTIDGSKLCAFCAGHAYEQLGQEETIGVS